MSDFRPYEDGWLSSFNPPIPEVYGDALTYLQQIKNLYKFVKEQVHHIKERLNWLEKNVENIAYEAGTQAAQEQLDFFSLELKRIESKLNNLILENIADHNEIRSYYTSKFNQSMSIAREALWLVKDLERTLPKKISDLMDDYKVIVDGRIDAFEILLNAEVEKNSSQDQAISNLCSNFLEFKRHINEILSTELERIESEIDEKIAITNADNLIVTSALTGKPVTLSTALAELVGGGYSMPITCSDFDGLNITCDEFDQRMLTCSQFDTLGYLIFFKDLYFEPIHDIIKEEIEKVNTRIDDLKNTKWISALSEVSMTPLQAYQELANYVISQHFNRLLCSDFDNLQISCSDFDNKYIKCLSFDISGGNINWS